jgi:hypothetical protein
MSACTGCTQAVFSNIVLGASENIALVQPVHSVHCILYQCSAVQLAVQCSAVQCSAVHSRHACRGSGGRIAVFLAGPRFAPQCTALHCTAIQCTALHCTALQYCTALNFEPNRVFARIFLRVWGSDPRPGIPPYIHCTALHCTVDPRAGLTAFGKCKVFY